MDASIFQGNLVRSDRIVYTPSPFAKENLIYLQEVGRLQALQPHTSQREHLASYLFFLVEEGEGSVRFGGSQFSLRKGDCAFLDCTTPYSHRSSDLLWSLKWVHFYGSNMPGIYEKYIQRGGAVCFTTEYFQEYSGLLDQLYDIAASEFYIRDMKLYEKLTSLLTLLMEESWNPAVPSADTRQGKRDIQPIRRYLEQNYQKKISLDELSEQFYINKYYLTRIFKEYYGLSISSYLQQLRITRAKQLLRFTDLPVENIGTQCGIPDPNYFSRIFRKIEGVSPGQFRSMWNKGKTDDGQQFRLH